MNTLSWDSEEPKRFLNKIGGLKLNPKFAPAVKYLTVSLCATVDSDPVYKNFAGGVGMLQSLRSLTLDGFFGPIPLDLSISLPKLEEFAVTDSYTFDYQLAVYFIDAHTANLKSVLFKNVDLFGTNDNKAWLQMLEAVHALRSEAVLEISLPSIQEETSYVSFSPPPEDFDLETHPLEVFIGEKQGAHGLHYSIKSGKLQCLWTS